MKTVTTKTALQISDFHPEVVEQGTKLRVLHDQTDVEHGKIRLQHPRGFAIVISRQHCTEPSEPLGKPIPLLYTSGELQRLRVDMQELNAFGAQLRSMVAYRMEG